jgi:hypothetical protein
LVQDFFLVLVFIFLSFLASATEESVTTINMQTLLAATSPEAICRRHTFKKESYWQTWRMCS